MSLILFTAEVKEILEYEPREKYVRWKVNSSAAVNRIPTETRERILAELRYEKEK